MPCSTALRASQGQRRLMLDKGALHFVDVMLTSHQF